MGPRIEFFFTKSGTHLSDVIQKWGQSPKLATSLSNIIAITKSGFSDVTCNLQPAPMEQLWPSGSPATCNLNSHPIILFDGVCNYCNSMVNFIIRQDRKKIFRFAALQSDAGQELLMQYHLPTTQMDSFILIDDGKAYQRSTAALHLYNKLPWYWKWIQVLWIVPGFLRDAVYNLIARNRYKWFGKKETCMMPNAEVRERFLE